MKPLDKGEFKNNSQIYLLSSLLYIKLIPNFGQFFYDMSWPTTKVKLKWIQNL